MARKERPTVAIRYSRTMTATSSASILRIVKQTGAVAAVLRRRECPSLAQLQQLRFVRTSTGTTKTVLLQSRKHHQHDAHPSTTNLNRWLHVSTDNDNNVNSIDTVVPIKVTRHAAGSGCSGSTLAPPSTPPTTILLDLERQRATELVDQLLERTRELMTKKSSNSSTDDGQNHDHNHHHHHIVAYSGGVDSSLVAALVHQNVTQLGCSEPQQQQYHSAEAVLGVSPAVPAEQIVGPSSHSTYWHGLSDDAHAGRRTTALCSQYRSSLSGL